MVEKKVYCLYVGEHSQRQGHLGESRVDMTRLSWAIWQRGSRRGGERCKSNTAARRPKETKTKTKRAGNLNGWVMQGRTA